MYSTINWSHLRHFCTHNMKKRVWIRWHLCKTWH